MAIVREFDHPNGAHVIIRDDCYRDASPEEIERRRAVARRTFTRIWLEIQEGRMKHHDERPEGAEAPD